MDKRGNAGGKFKLVPAAVKVKKGQLECVNTSSSSGKK